MTEIDPAGPGQPPRRRLAAVVAIGLVVVGVFAAAAAMLLGRGSVPASSPLVGRPAPALRLVTTDGTSAREIAEPGRVTFVNFMAPWCVPCLQEHRDFNDAVARWPGTSDPMPDDVAIVAVVFQSDLTDVDRFLDRVGRAVPTLFDPEGAAAIEFGVVGVPETFVVDRAGVVRGRIVGTVEAAQLALIVDRLDAGGSIDDLL
jgi:cytochrome c biogenesis protein CcmG/thiol:disulfide interchange protein DsbE